MLNKIKCFSALALMLIFSACFSGVSQDYVLTVDGDKISLEEYNVYFNEQINIFEEQGGSDIWEIDFDGESAVNVAKQNAVNTLVMVKAAAAHAEQLGVSLDDNDKAEAAKRAEAIKNDGSDMGLLTRIMEESIIQSKVYEQITGSYQVNDAEFEAYLQSYYDENRVMYTKYTVKEIFLQYNDESISPDNIKSIFDTIKTESDFDNAAVELSPDTPVAEQEFDASLYSQDVIDNVIKADEDSIVYVEDNTGYHIFYIKDIQVTPVDDIREDIKNQYIDENKQEIYNAQNNTWTASMKVEKNNSVYDGITIEK